MSVRYEPNLAYELGLEDQGTFRHGMSERTKAAAGFVVAVAPKHTGYYARRIRATGNEVRAFDPFWFLVEFGSVNNPPYRPLTRGVRAAGLRFVPLPKH